MVWWSVTSRPEAQVGGLIALVHEGDSITIDANKHLLTLNVPEAEIAQRRSPMACAEASIYPRRAGEVRGPGVIE